MYYSPCVKTRTRELTFQKGEKRMRKQYDELDIKIICLNAVDVVTASGDNFQDDPWYGVEY